MTSPPTSNPPINPAQSTTRSCSADSFHTVAGFCPPSLTGYVNRQVHPIRIHSPTIPTNRRRILTVTYALLPANAGGSHAGLVAYAHCLAPAKSILKLTYRYRRPSVTVGSNAEPILSFEPCRYIPSLKIVEYAHNSQHEHTQRDDPGDQRYVLVLKIICHIQNPRLNLVADLIGSSPSKPKATSLSPL